MSRRISPLGDLRAFAAMMRLIRTAQPDIVHAYDTKPAVWARLAARRAGISVVVATIPGLGSLYANPGFGAKLARAVYEPLQAFACRAGDVTIFQNADDRHEFEVRNIVEPQRTAIIPGSGVRTDHFTPDVPPERRAMLRHEWGVATGDVVVVMIARLARTKGVLEFAAAARTANSLEPGLRFVLVGPEDRNGVDGLNAGEVADVAASVTWLGPRADVKEILGGSDIVALPSYYREGIPRVLLEAAAMALPLVAADVPGSRDVVRPDVNGILVPPRDVPALTDALVTLARDEARRRRFGEAARRIAIEEYDLGRIAAQTEALYLSLLERKGQASVEHG